MALPELAPQTPLVDLPAPQRQTATLLLACCLFVLSGACGLAYEVVWTRYLGLFVGNTVLLHTAVLGTFMGGLALGSLLIGRRIGQICFPLKAYGWLEIAVAAYAMAFPTLSGLGQSAVGAAAASFGPGTGALLAVKLAVALALIAPPTLLMGMTLPLLTAHVERAAPDTREAGGDGANWLYCANCAGAVLGTLVTGFYLIPSLGLAGTVLGVALVNAAIGLTAVALGRGAAVAEPESDTSTLAIVAPTNDRPVLWAICLSGATAFLYELVWTRLFAVSLGSSTYSFTLMLAAFITGLALGSVAAGILPVRRSPLLWLAGAEIAIGLAIAVSLTLYPRLPYVCWQWRWMLRAIPETLPLYRFVQYSLIFCVMAVPTTLFGLTFPAAIRAASAGSDAVAAQAARVYGWNTIGTLLGVSAAGFVLIPLLGLQTALQIGAAINLAIGAVLLRDRLRSIALPLALGAIALVAAPRWQPGAFTYGQFRANVAAPPSFAAFQDGLRREPLLFYREDFGTTVAVRETTSYTPGVSQRVLFVDGKADASSLDDMPTQRLLAHLPLFLKADAKNVFVLGLGSGTSAGSVLAHPGIERVDCVELSQAVADAETHFSKVNGNPRADSRFHLTVDDGKAFLAAAAPGRYDIIVSEPTNPWIAGVGTLFSEETFQQAARALKADGLVAQWFHTYSIDDALVATILRTCRRVFPHAVLFQGTSNDYILVASRQPLSVDFAAMERAFAHPRVRADLEQIRIRSVLALLSQQTHTTDGIAALEQDGGINSDDLPLLEFLAPLSLYVGATAQKIKATDARLTDDPNLLAAGYLATRPLTRELARTRLESLTSPDMSIPAVAQKAIAAYRQRFP